MKAFNYSPSNYDMIRDELLEGDPLIIDIGCGNGLNALTSRHGREFEKAGMSNRYFGFDKVALPQNYLPVFEKDILDNDITDDLKADLVLCLHVIEHVKYRHWPQLFDNLKGLVKKGGTLMVACPYDEPKEGKHYYQRDGAPVAYHHQVFGITKELINNFLFGADIRIVFKRPAPFWEDGVSLGYALLRYAKRRLKGHFLTRKRFDIIAEWIK